MSLMHETLLGQTIRVFPQPARGEREQARKLLQSVENGTYVDHHVAYSMGVAYTQLGDLTEAQRWLTRSTQTGFPCYPWFVQDPLLKPLRDDPGSQTFLNQLREAWDVNKKRYEPSPK